ncbi:MAG: O-antigen ligase family protein [Rickettsiales bacterium]
MSPLNSPAVPLVFAAFTFPLCAMLSALATAPILIITLLWWLTLQRHSFKAATPLLRFPVSWGTMALILLAGGSYFWAIQPEEVSDALPRLVALFAGGTAGIYALARNPLSAEHAMQTGRALLRGFGLALALTFLAVIFDGGAAAWLDAIFSSSTPFKLHDLNRGAVLLSLLIWPVLYLLFAQGRILLATACMAATLLGIALLASATALVATLCGMACFAFVIVAGIRISHIAIIIGLTALFIALPVYVGAVLDVDTLMERFPTLPPSLEHRLLIWQFVLERIGEHPLLGWGLKASNFIPGGQDPVLDRLVALPLHPHNNMLQSQLELGIGGLCLYLAFLFYTLHAIRMKVQHLPRPQAAAFFSMFITWTTVGMAGYGLWQSWWLCAAFLSVLLVQAILPAQGNGQAHQTA